MENYKIYVHINKINGKIYIGQTGQEDVKDRWDSGWGYKSCVAFNNAINKYGWNNFKHVVLIDGLSLEMANIVEEELIKKYKSTNSKYGYNIRSGGENSTLSEESKEKIRQKALGRKASEETKRKIKDHWKKYGHPFQGRHHTEETKQKIAIANTGRPKSKKELEDAHYRVLGELNPFYGKHHTDETKKVLSDLAKERYLSEDNPFYGKHHTNESKKKMSEAHKKIPKEKHGRYGKKNSESMIRAVQEAHYKEVIQYDLQYKEIARYKSVTEAAEVIGCSRSAISKCCTRVNKTCQGYIFLYVDDVEKEREVS